MLVERVFSDRPAPAPRTRRPRCPQRSSGRPATATSATAGCSESTFSTSTGVTLGMESRAGLSAFPSGAVKTTGFPHRAAPPRKSNRAFSRGRERRVRTPPHPACRIVRASTAGCRNALCNLDYLGFGESVVAQNLLDIRLGKRFQVRRQCRLFLPWRNPGVIGDAPDKIGELGDGKIRMRPQGPWPSVSGRYSTPDSLFYPPCSGLPTRTGIGSSHRSTDVLPDVRLPGSRPIVIRWCSQFVHPPLDLLCQLLELPMNASLADVLSMASVIDGDPFGQRLGDPRSLRDIRLQQLRLPMFLQ